MSTVPLATCALRRTTAPGTTRIPASRNFASSQPANLSGTLSKAGAPAEPYSITVLSLRRKLSSTAFLSHWLTTHSPSIFSATRALPESSRPSASSTILRTSSLAGVTVSRASNAASMAASSSDIAGSLRIESVSCRAPIAPGRLGQAKGDWGRAVYAGAPSSGRISSRTKPISPVWRARRMRSAARISVTFSKQAWMSSLTTT